MDVAGRLSELQRLHSDGALSDDEFAQAKSLVLQEEEDASAIPRLPDATAEARSSASQSPVDGSVVAQGWFRWPPRPRAIVVMVAWLAAIAALFAFAISDDADVAERGTSSTSGGASAAPSRPVLSGIVAIGGDCPSPVLRVGTAVEVSDGTGRIVAVGRVEEPEPHTTQHGLRACYYPYEVKVPVVDVYAIHVQGDHIETLSREELEEEGRLR